MQANLTRGGANVGVFRVAQDGTYSWDCMDDERERFEDAIKPIIEDLRNPASWSGREGSEIEARVIGPGDPRWFDRVLARLQNKGYEHAVVEDDAVDDE
jgi:hypothetical protein